LIPPDLIAAPLVEPAVLRIADCGVAALRALLNRYGMALHVAAKGEVILGSYWGESEAGLLGDMLYVRLDTPIHSALHEACHFVCMDAARRGQLNRDAGGDYDEENAVCYLQILLASQLPGFSRARMQSDMDAWGYTFRLGSARAWFEQDADDAYAWLQREGIVNQDGVTWRLRN
jgi:hypothetical protein